MEIIAATERLLLRKFIEEDASFIQELLNTPSWIKYIGDRNVKSIEDGKNYITERFIPHYQKMGFGFYAVISKDSKTCIGMCGLVKRDGLDGVDIGFAFMPNYEGKGYAKEAALATLQHAKELNIHILLAITIKDNIKSIKLLERLGFAFKRFTTIPNDDEELMLFSINL